jgi:hypothetical protein
VKTIQIENPQKRERRIAYLKAIAKEKTATIPYPGMTQEQISRANQPGNGNPPNGHPAYKKILAVDMLIRQRETYFEHLRSEMRKVEAELRTLEKERSAVITSLPNHKCPDHRPAGKFFIDQAVKQEAKADPWKVKVAEAAKIIKVKKNQINDISKLNIMDMEF